MFEILDKHYKARCGLPIQFAKLGHSTSNFNFFVTTSISKSITLSQGSGSDGSLMNKLISLSSEGKFSIIDSVIDKASKGSLAKKKKTVSFNEESKGETK